MKLCVRIFALALLIAAVAAVFFYHGAEPVEDDTPLPVRPVKSVVVGPPTSIPHLQFPGVVDASASVDLSFEVNGRIVEFPVSRGQEVKEGQLLARLDDRNYANQVKNAEAELAYAESNFARIKAALEQNAVSIDEFSRARASADKARAALEIAQKALEDTRLTARFSGVVSDTYANNFDTVSAGKPILKLQDITTLDLIVSVPESYVFGNPAASRVNFTFEASFDSLPGRVFPVRVKDAARIADSVTQTYRATFALDAPEDLNILPGMTCTVTVSIPVDAAPNAQKALLEVPANAVGNAADKTSFVWRLDDKGDGTYEIHRATVTLGERSENNILVVDGLNAGDRIAVAGITILTEGRVVRLLDEEAEEAKNAEATDNADPTR